MWCCDCGSDAGFKEYCPKCNSRNLSFFRLNQQHGDAVDAADSMEKLCVRLEAFFAGFLKNFFVHICWTLTILSPFALYYNWKDSAIPVWAMIFSAVIGFGSVILLKRIPMPFSKGELVRNLAIRFPVIVGAIILVVSVIGSFAAV